MPSETKAVASRLLEDNIVRWAEIAAAREVLLQEAARTSDAIKKTKKPAYRAQLERRMPVLRIGQLRMEEKLLVVDHNILVLAAAALKGRKGGK